MIAMGSDGDVLIQVDYKNYIIPTHPALYINHSCTPTVGIRDDYSFIALKYLHRGEELTLDYSTTMLERLWTLNCACGSPKCRSKIEDFDLIPAMLQQYYLERDVVQNFIAEEVGYHPDEIAA